MLNNEEKKLIDITELAQVLGVRRSWIYQRTCQGQHAIPHLKLGKYLRFNPEEVIQFFKANQKELV